MFIRFLIISFLSFFLAITLNAQKIKKQNPQKKIIEIKIYYQHKVIFQFTKPDYIHFRDSINTQTKDALHRLNDHAVEWRPFVQKMALKQSKEKKFIVFKNGELIDSLEASRFRIFKDSIGRKTKDTLFIDGNNKVQIHLFDRTHKKASNIQKPKLVFLNNRGYISLNLPLLKLNNYRVVFYEADGSVLFEMKNIKETNLVLDKTNFMHAGIFLYEVFEEEKLIEKGQINLQK